MSIPMPAINLVVGKVAVKHLALAYREGAAPIFVYPTADVVIPGGELSRLHARPKTHHHRAAFLPGPAFKPVYPVTVDSQITQRGYAGHQKIRGDGRFPGTIGSGSGHERSLISIQSNRGQRGIAEGRQAFKPWRSLFRKSRTSADTTMVKDIAACSPNRDA